MDMEVQAPSSARGEFESQAMVSFSLKCIWSEPKREPKMTPQGASLLTGEERSTLRRPTE